MLQDFSELVLQIFWTIVYGYISKCEFTKSVFVVLPRFCVYGPFSQCIQAYLTYPVRLSTVCLTEFKQISKLLAIDPYRNLTTNVAAFLRSYPCYQDTDTNQRLIS